MVLWEIDWREPLRAFAPLAGECDAHMLHGGALSAAAPWSIIAAFPEAMVSADDSDPFRALDEHLQERRAPVKDELAALPFVSGAVGFVGYEAARFFEPSLRLPAAPFPFPDVCFGLYDAAALFSRTRREAFIAGRSEAACRRLRDALGVDPLPPSNAPDFSGLLSNFTKEKYEDAVAEAIESILDGDFYQVNLTHQLAAIAAKPVAPFDLFRLLTAQSDAGHGALLQYGSGAIVSNSPERFFKIEPGAYGRRRIVSEPIKGTRRRGSTPAEDAALAQALCADPKDRAENTMIADLLRNDLSRICEDGTLREEAICELMSLANVHHLVSRISGIVKPETPLSGIFAALFPCGSITGAPKIEAMKTIARMEAVGRGPYCGAIGYADDRGLADFSVAIRTLMIEGARITLPVGGGVTLRSTPQAEYEETIVKAQGALVPLGINDEAVR